MNFSYINENNVLASFRRLSKKRTVESFLHNEVLASMLERLSLIKLAPQKILVIEGLKGDTGKVLSQQYPQAQIINLSFEEILKSSSLDVGAVDMIFSCLNLHYFDDLALGFQKLSQMLSPEGLFFFTLLGPDTLKEYRHAWLQVNDYAHVQLFYDMHDVGDALLTMNFTEPVMDMVFMTVNYRTVTSFLNELKEQVPTNYLVGKNPGLTGKNQWQAMLNQYEQYRDAKGYLPVTCEIIYGHAWGKGFSQKQEKNKEGDTIIPLSKIQRKV